MDNNLRQYVVENAIADVKGYILFLITEKDVKRPSFKKDQTGYDHVQYVKMSETRKCKRWNFAQSF